MSQNHADYEVMIEQVDALLDDPDVKAILAEKLNQ